jgi:peptidoglycan/LPS O-acetylase OafA/YrhL
MNPSRIRHLDGLRGLAIAAVVLYHAFERWSDLIMAAPNQPATPLLEHGWLGVYLFFLISGFVILMTLEQCDGFSSFLRRRWTRLFPAMLAASLLIYATVPLLPMRPAGIPMSEDLLPGLLFMDPVWLDAISDLKYHSLEGAFWSIFVEVKFYLASGILYFFGGLLPMVIVLTACYVSWHAAEHFQWLVLKSVLDPLGAKYFGWFVAGALFYICSRTRKRSHLIGATAFAALVVFIGMSTASLKPALGIVALFALGICSTRLQHALSHPLLLFMGSISYALYLLHENMIVALTLQLKSWLPGVDARLLALPPIALAILLAYVVTSYFETPVRRLLSKLMEGKFSGKLRH